MTSLRQVPRLLFRKLVSSEYAQLVTLHAGEAYALQNLTRTDRLGILLAGRCNVLSDNSFLHGIGPNQFLDSPEFESTKATAEEKFKVGGYGGAEMRWMWDARKHLTCGDGGLENFLFDRL